MEPSKIISITRGLCSQLIYDEYNIDDNNINGTAIVNCIIRYKTKIKKK